VNCRRWLLTLPTAFRQHETILYQGDPGEMRYRIQSGRVRIYVLDVGLYFGLIDWSLYWQGQLLDGFQTMIQSSLKVLDDF
jgi:hypothetical protein